MIIHIPANKTPKGTTMNKCEICGRTDAERPSIFRGERWCSDNHRKMILGEKPHPTKK